MPAAVNEFLQGVDRDTDNLKIKNTFLRDGLNVRLINVEGQGFVATNIKGNSKRFMLKDGYIPLGHCVYGGIAYIASYNSDLDRSEIGSFPSPNPSGTGLLPLYNALNNFTGNLHPRDPNNPDQEFNFDNSILKNPWSADSIVRMFGRIDYDNSTNIYFADNSNPNFVINSGFRQDGSRILDQSGSVTERRYGDRSFPNFVSVLHETPIKPRVNSLTPGYGVIKGGSLRAGNWHIFLRYINESFDATSWSAESNALAVAYDDSTRIIAKGADSSVKTDKKIRLGVANLDTNYKYLEIGYQYSGDGSKEYGRLDRKIEIPVDGSPINIEFDGSETIIEMNVSELIKVKPRFDVSKDHTDLEGRYFMSNLSDSTNYNDDSIQNLRDFALSIKPSYVIKPAQFRESLTDIGDPSKMNSIYGDSTNVYSMPGYFRGEMYPFAVVYILKNGRETDAFPIEGRDDYTGSTTSTNENGVYRFPSADNEVIISSGQRTDLRIMGISFDPSDSVNNELTSWIEDNVEGYYYVRGERIPNLFTQGVSMPCYTTDVSYVDDENVTRLARSFNYEFNIWKDNDAGTGNRVDELTLERRNKNYLPLKYINNPTGYPFIVDPGQVIELVNSNASIGTPLLADVDTSAGDALFENIPGSDIPTYDVTLASNGGIQMHAYTGMISDQHKVAIISPDYHINNFTVPSNLYVVGHGEYINSFESNFLSNPPNINSNQNICMLPYYFAPFESISYSPVLPFTPGDVIDGDEKKSYAVVPWELSNNAGFISKTNEGTKDGAGTWYYKEEFRDDREGQYYRIKNASFAIPGYIGLDMGNSSGLFTPGSTRSNSFLVNLYFKNPKEFTSEEIGNYYDPKSTKYYKISEFNNIDSASNTIDLFQGDCFLQRTFIKMMSDTRPSSEGVETSKFGINNDKLDEILLEELVDSGANDTPAARKTGDTFGCVLGANSVVSLIKQNTNLNSFGYIMEFFTENSVNTELRHDNFTNKCYPQSYSDNIKDLKKFAIRENSQESSEYNIGYSQILSDKAFSGNDETLPEIVSKYPTRIQYSNKHINGSYLDGYKLIDLAAYQDYDYRMGEIISIRVLHGKLYSIQERGISAHHVNDRAILSEQSTNTGNLTIGNGEILAEKHLTLTDNYGSQHIESIVRSDNYLYGFDFNKRKVWRIGSGNQGVELISDTKLFRKDVVEACEFESEFSDASEFLPDTPNNGIGIVSGFDRKFNEVNFTIVGFDKNQSGAKTLVFSEFLDSYIGKRSYTPHFYATIEEDFFTTHRSQPNRNEFFYHDSDDVDRSNFYGVQFTAYITATINIESDVIKDWYNWEISAGPEIPHSIEYATEHQRGTQFPFLATETYLKPEYRENKWFLPIRRADSIVNDPNAIYGNQTAFRGDYINIKLIYTDEIMKVKSFVTWFEKSYT